MKQIFFGSRYNIFLDFIECFLEMRRQTAITTQISSTSYFPRKGRVTSAPVWTFLDTCNRYLGKFSNL